MPTYKTLSSADIKTTRSNLNQLIDFVEEDVSGSLTRKNYQVFITGSGTYAVTSSIFQTVYDQDYTLQTANEIFDMTMGVFRDTSVGTVISGSSTGEDINGKLLFSSQSLMMREKINVYRQFSQNLLGDAASQFYAPFSSTSDDDKIESAFFMAFKRLFVRDGIKRESFAMRMFQSGASRDQTGVALDELADSSYNMNGNLEVTIAQPSSSSVIFTDVGSATSIESSQFGGDVGNLVLASNTSHTVGLIFYQQGIAVLDLARAIDGNQVMSGTISCVGESDGGTVPLSGSFIPHFVTSGSIDAVVDHIALTRFGSGSNTFLTFQNNTQINSTLVFCRATADEFNFSSNPTYADSDGRIQVIDESQQGVQKAFSFVTTVGLYDANEELLAVAKLSRPVEKNDEKDLTFRVRLDF